MWPGAQGLFNHHNSSCLRTSYLPHHKYTLDGLVRAVPAARLGTVIGLFHLKSFKLYIDYVFD